MAWPVQQLLRWDRDESMRQVLGAAREARYVMFYLLVPRPPGTPAANPGKQIQARTPLAQRP